MPAGEPPETPHNEGKPDESTEDSARAENAPRASEQPQSDARIGEDEAVWTYRGYRLRSGEFNTAMVHFFRAEVQRANVWRQRLDATTNWAVVTTGAVLSLTFNAQVTHLLIMINVILVTMFLFIEGRRYRYYELWSYRVRLMETDFFAAMLVPPFHPSPDWAEALAESLLQPHYPISLWEAIGRRLRRNYLWVYGVVTLAWLLKLFIHPEPAVSMVELTARAGVGPIPGEFVFFFTLSGVLALLGLALFTAHLREASGEVLPRYIGFSDAMIASLGEKNGKRMRAWFRQSRRRQQLLTFIVTDQAKVVTARILKDMGRGVTSLSGTGMYTGASHAVLLCALTVTEIPQLKALVAEEDPRAFVVVSPAKEIFGGGFGSLQEEE